MIQDYIKKTEKDENAISYIVYKSLLNNIGSGLNDLNVSIETSILYEDIQAANSIITELFNNLHTSENYDKLFGGMNNEIQSVFNLPRTPILELSVLNYFALNDNRLENITFKKVFSDDGDFYQNFIEGLDEYLEEKAKLLGISEDKIEKMLTN